MKTVKTKATKTQAESLVKNQDKSLKHQKKKIKRLRVKPAMLQLAISNQEMKIPWSVLWMLIQRRSLMRWSRWKAMHKNVQWHMSFQRWARNGLVVVKNHGRGSECVSV